MPYKCTPSKTLSNLLLPLCHLGDIRSIYNAMHYPDSRRKPRENETRHLNCNP